MPRSMWGDGEAPLLHSWDLMDGMSVLDWLWVVGLHLFWCTAVFLFRPVRLRLGGYTGHCRGRLADLDT